MIRLNQSSSSQHDDSHEAENLDSSCSAKSTASFPWFNTSVTLTYKPGLVFSSASRFQTYLLTLTIVFVMHSMSLKGILIVFRFISAGVLGSAVKNCLNLGTKGKRSLDCLVAIELPMESISIVTEDPLPIRS